jgi:signal transduction histidine kinase
VADVDGELGGLGGLVAERLIERPDGDYQFRREGYVGGHFFLIVAPSGEIRSNPQHVALDAIPPELFPRDRPVAATLELDDEPVRLYLRSLPPRASGPVAVAVGKSLVPEYDTLRQVLLVLLVAGAAGLALSCGGAWFLAGRALIPIEAAFRRQQEFVADASHELRTPLTVLRSATELLSKHRDEPLAANAELFDDVRHEIARLERQTTDLLTLARADLGELALAMGDVELGALAAEVVRRATPLAVEREVALTCERPPAPLVVDADPDRLQQVLLILLDNALKHTPTGGTVRVAVRRQGREAQLEVVDSGAGIPPEHLPRIFDRYYRADRARTRDGGGSGLGLAIARSLVDAHGGQLTLANVPGGGARATVRLHLPPATASLADRLSQLAGQMVHRAPPS